MKAITRDYALRCLVDKSTISRHEINEEIIELKIAQLKLKHLSKKEKQYCRDCGAYLHEQNSKAGSLRCNLCHNKNRARITAKWKANNKEKNREISRQWKTNNREKENEKNRRCYHRKKVKELQLKILSRDPFEERDKFISRKQKALLYYQQNKKRLLPLMRKRSSKYYQENKEKVLAKHRKDAAYARKHFTDTYIKKLLTDQNALSFSDIPEDLVNLKRKQIELLRLYEDNESTP